MSSLMAPESTLSQDPVTRPPLDSTGCVCRPGGLRAGFDECTCEWGELLRKLLYLGYGATRKEATEHLADLGGRMNMLATRRRREILQELLNAWPRVYTVEAFCNTYGITRARYDNLGLKRPA